MKLWIIVLFPNIWKVNFSIFKWFPNFSYSVTLFPQSTLEDGPVPSCSSQGRWQHSSSFATRKEPQFFTSFPHSRSDQDSVEITPCPQELAWPLALVLCPIAPCTEPSELDHSVHKGSVMYTYYFKYIFTELPLCTQLCAPSHPCLWGMYGDFRAAHSEHRARDPHWPTAPWRHIESCTSSKCKQGP